MWLHDFHHHQTATASLQLCPVPAVPSSSWLLVVVLLGSPQVDKKLYYRAVMVRSFTTCRPPMCLTSVDVWISHDHNFSTVKRHQLWRTARGCLGGQNICATRAYHSPSLTTKVTIDIFRLFMSPYSLALLAINHLLYVHQCTFFMSPYCLLNCSLLAHSFLAAQS